MGYGGWGCTPLPTALLLTGMHGMAWVWHWLSIGYIYLPSKQ